MTLLRQVRLSEASDSQVLGLMFTSLWDSLKQSLKRFFCQDGRYELAGTAKLPLYLPGQQRSQEVAIPLLEFFTNRRGGNIGL